MRRFAMRIVILFVPSVVLLWWLSPFAVPVIAQDSLLPMWDFFQKSRQPCMDINDGRCFNCVNAGETFNPYYVVYSNVPLYDAKVGSSYSGIVEVKVVPCTDKIACELGYPWRSRVCTSSTATVQEYCTVDGAIDTNVCWDIIVGKRTRRSWAETDAPKNATSF